MQWISDNWVLVVLIGGVLAYFLMRRRGDGHGHSHLSQHNQHHNDDQSKERDRVHAAPIRVSDPSDQDPGNTREKRD